MSPVVNKDQGKIGLGTAKFGMDYGISNHIHNTRYKCPELEVRNILQSAQERNLQVIDTAAAYGDSETVLGNCLAVPNKFKLVTKTTAINSTLILADHILQIETNFLQSLKNLRQNNIYGILIHRAEDLIHSGSERLYDYLLSIKEKGYVSKIGVSVYNAEQIEQIFSKYALDLIQVPLNIFDQRLIRSGHLKMLKEKNVEIHIRSVFLQGVLLLDSSTLPQHFSSIKKHLEFYFQELKQQNLTALEAALGFVLRVAECDAIICGVGSNAHLIEILESCQPLPDPTWANQFALDDVNILNPALWKI